SNPGNGQMIFVAKYDPSGNVVWATSAGKLSSLYGPSITADALGNTYVTGYFLNMYAAFGTTTLTSAGQHEIFLVKFDTQGNQAWARRAGGAFADLTHDISSDSEGNVYITGSFVNNASFNLTPLYGYGAHDVFVTKYDPTGNVLWAKRAGG